MARYYDITVRAKVYKESLSRSMLEVCIKESLNRVPGVVAVGQCKAERVDDSKIVKRESDRV